MNDADFRERLLDDPNAAVGEELGVAIPDTLTIRVHEEDAGEARRAIHAVVSESEGLYVAECLEVADVTQGASLDATLANLHEALDLYMSGEDCAWLGLAPEPRLALSFETSARSA